MNKTNRLRKQLTQRDHYQSHYKYVGLKSAIITSSSIISLVPCPLHFFLLNQLLWGDTYTLIINVCSQFCFQCNRCIAIHKVERTSIFSSFWWKKSFIMLHVSIKVKTIICMLRASKSSALLPPCWHIKFSKMGGGDVSYSWISINARNFPLLSGFGGTYVER